MKAVNKFTKVIAGLLAMAIFAGLFLFVAIPLPGTGAYSGSLIAALLDMRLSKAIPSIVAGIFVAGLIMTILSMCGAVALG